MIDEAYMPVYRCPDFHGVRAGGRVRGSTRGSTRGPRGPKNTVLQRSESKIGPSYSTPEVIHF